MPLPLLPIIALGVISASVIRLMREDETEETTKEQPHEVRQEQPPSDPDRVRPSRSQQFSTGSPGSADVQLEPEPEPPAEVAPEETEPEPTAEAAPGDVQEDTEKENK